MIGCRLGMVRLNDVIGAIEKSNGGILGSDDGMKGNGFTKEKSEGVNDWVSASINIDFS